MRFRFYIDGVLVAKEPDGWKDFRGSIRRDQADRFLFVEYTTQLQLYTGAGYDEVYAYIDANNYGKLIDFEVERFNESTGLWSSLLQGVIDISEAEFDFKRRTALIYIRDTNLATLVNKNRSLEVATYQESSKNGVTISKPTPQDVDLSIATKQGTFLRTVRAYEWGSLVDYLIDYVGDGQVTVVNNFYTNYSGQLFITPVDALVKGLSEIEILGDFENRPESKRFVTTSIEEAYNDVAKIYNVWMISTRVSDQDEIVIDTADNLYSLTEAFALTAIDEKKLKIFQEEMYTQVQVGQRDEVSQSGFYNATTPEATGWKSSNYQLKGNVNERNNTLTLDTGLIYSGISVFLFSMRQTIESGGGDYAINPLVGSYETNALLRAVDNAVPLEDLEDAVYLTEMDSNASVVDIESYDVAEVTTENVTVTRYQNWINAEMTNDKVVARYDLPFDAYIASNPNPDVTVTVFLNDTMPSQNRTEDDAVTSATVEAEILDLVNNAALGAVDPYDQWDNTEHHFLPAAVTGRIDKFQIGGTVQIRITKASLTGYRVKLYAGTLIGGEYFWDELRETQVLFGTGLKTIGIPPRQYAAFDNNTAVALSALVIPESRGIVVDLWNTWSYIPAWIETVLTGTSSVIGLTITEPSTASYDVVYSSLRIGYEYTITVPARHLNTTGDYLLRIYDNNTLIVEHTVTEDTLTDYTATFVAASVFLKVQVVLNGGVNSGTAILGRPILEGRGEVSYFINDNLTELEITQDGFDGETYSLADAANYKGYIFDIHGHVPIDDWEQLMNDPRKYVVIDGVKVWPKDVSYNFHTGEIQGEFITDYNNLNPQP